MKKFSFTKLFLLVALPLACVTAPALAYADGEGIAAILPNLQEFVPLLVAFIILCLVLWKFGWPMFEKIMDDRRKSIQDDLESASKSKEEAERVLQENKKELAQAKEESAKIQNAAKQSAKTSSKEIIADAQNQAEEIKQKAQDLIDKRKVQAQRELKGDVVNLSIEIIEKFVSEDLSDAEHRKIIEKYIDEMGPINA